MIDLGMLYYYIGMKIWSKDEGIYFSLHSSLDEVFYPLYNGLLVQQSVENNIESQGQMVLLCIIFALASHEISGWITINQGVRNHGFETT
jgi:hypothetical protein